jgi:hypothetical protein
MIRYGLRSGEISRHTGPIITDTATSPTKGRAHAITCERLVRRLWGSPAAGTAPVACTYDRTSCRHPTVVN